MPSTVAEYHVHCTDLQAPDRGSHTAGCRRGSKQGVDHGARTHAELHRRGRHSPVPAWCSLCQPQHHSLSAGWPELPGEFRSTLHRRRLPGDGRMCRGRSPSQSAVACDRWGLCLTDCFCVQGAAADGTTVLLPQETPFYFKPGDNPLQLYAAWPGEQASHPTSSRLTLASPSPNPHLILSRHSCLSRPTPPCSRSRATLYG